MGTWKSRGLRGSTLEDMINHTNEIYREKKLALIQKIPTPITPITIEKSTRHITLAYFDQKSTVDYIGAVQGIPVCFDAKECAVKTFPLQNVHEHQIRFMKEFEEQGGIAFIILHFLRWMKCTTCPSGIWRNSGRAWKLAGAKASSTMKSIKPIRSTPAGIFWCIIWRRSRKISRNGIPHNKNLFPYRKCQVAPIRRPWHFRYHSIDLYSCPSQQ